MPTHALTITKKLAETPGHRYPFCMDHTATADQVSEPAFTPFRIFFMLFASVMAAIVFVVLLYRMDILEASDAFWWEYVEAIWVMINWLLGGSRPLDVLLACAG